MSARFAVFDSHTDRDVGEFADLPSAYAEVDRLKPRRTADRYGVRIARHYREVIDQSWKVRTVTSRLRAVS